MEVAKVNREDSKFEIDDIYEQINAPQWFDFNSPDDPDNNDDAAWFCRLDCNHPTSVEDFLKQPPTPQSKFFMSTSVSEVLPLGDQNLREAALKKRGIPQTKNCSAKDFNSSGNRYEGGDNMDSCFFGARTRIIPQVGATFRRLVSSSYFGCWCL